MLIFSDLAVFLRIKGDLIKKLWLVKYLFKQKCHIVHHEHQEVNR